MNIIPLTPSAWEDYELIDSGNGQKLERFGRWVVARPEPQALWKPTLPDWSKYANAVFVRNLKSDERGEWRLDSKMPQQWVVGYRNLKCDLG